MDNFASTLEGKTSDEKQSKCSSKTEEKIVLDLGEKPLDVTQEIWLDIIKFRHMQAENEIVNDNKRKDLVMKEVGTLEAEREERRLASEAPSKPSADSRKTRPESAPIAKPEIVDFTLKKDTKLGNLNMKFETKASKRSKGALVAGQEAEEEEESKRRKLVPLEYTEEERAAARTVAERIADVAARITQSAATEGAGKSVVGKIKELVTNYLGEADQSLVDFVSGKIKSGAKAEEIEAGLRDVLDEDAVEFTKELFVFINS